MKGKGLLKKLTACLLAAVMMVSVYVPVSAASYTRTQKIFVDTGQSYHIMNNNISRNKVKEYTLVVVPMEAGTRFDLAMGYGGNEEVVKNCTQGYSAVLKTPSYVKTSSSSNAGMIACVKVTKGSVQVGIQYSNGYKNASVLTFKKQAASHQTLKAVTVKKNKKVLFQRKGSNLKSTSLVIASKSGSVTRRTLSVPLNEFENYTFNANNLSYRYYYKGVLGKSLNKKYDTKLGSTGYIMMRITDKLSGWFTTKSGSVTFYYPTDYAKIGVTLK
ncbi:MAG: hypothetical protein Q4D16_24625 [Eubacteriales bacterium]|nr:hypothetical protein [Eubacteriales bacterium]